MYEGTNASTGTLTSGDENSDDDPMPVLVDSSSDECAGGSETESDDSSDESSNSSHGNPESSDDDAALTSIPACAGIIKLVGIEKDKDAKKAKEMKVVRFGNEEVQPYSSAYADPNRFLWMKPSRVRRKDYQHPEKLDSDNELQQAQLRALTLEESVKIDNERDDGRISPFLEADAPIGWRRKIIKNVIPRSSAAAKVINGRFRRWLVDTGCPIDLVASDDLTDSEMKYVREVADGIRLNTANGRTKTSGVLNFEIEGLADDVEAHVLTKTPTVFSLGKRCMNLGYSFEWRAGKNPVLITPRGKKIVLEVIDDVPYLPQVLCWPCDSDDVPVPILNALAGPVATSEVENEASASGSGSSSAAEEFVTMTADRVDRGVSKFQGPPRHMCKWKDVISRRTVDTKTNALIASEDIDHASDAEYFGFLPGCDASRGLEMMRPRRDIKTTFTYKIKLSSIAESSDVDSGTDSVLHEDASSAESDAEGIRSKRDLKKEAKSLKHLMTHFPKNKYCSVCMRANMQNVRYQNKGGAEHHKAEQFGDHATGDSMALHGLKNRGFHGERNAVVLRDVATAFIDTYPCKTRDESDAHDAFRYFEGPNDKIKYWYSDKAPELLKAAQMMKWKIDSATPGMPWTNGLAESTVKLVLHGGRACLMGAGLPAKYWPYATKYFCMASNIEIEGGTSPWFERHGSQFTGMRLPFGCLVDYYPTPKRPDSAAMKANKEAKETKKSKGASAEGDDAASSSSDEEKHEDDARDEENEALNIDEHEWLKSNIEDSKAKFDPTSSAGIFLGYALESGAKWRGNYIVANLADFRKGKARPRIQEVKRIYHNPDEGYIFPLKPLYDIKTRVVKARAEAGAGPDRESVPEAPAGELEARPRELEVNADELEFKFDELPEEPEDELDPIIGKSLKKLRSRDPECTYADWWERIEEKHQWVFHHISDRKAMFVPTKCRGGPAVDSIDPARLTYMKFNDGVCRTYVDSHLRANAKERMVKYWRGFTVFFDKGHTPDEVATIIERKRGELTNKDEVLREDAEKPTFANAEEELAWIEKKYPQYERKERRYDGPERKSKKPNWIDSASYFEVGKAGQRAMKLLEEERQRERARAIAEMTARWGLNAESTAASSGAGGSSAAPALCEITVTKTHNKAEAPNASSENPDVVLLKSLRNVVIPPKSRRAVRTGIGLNMPKGCSAHFGALTKKDIKHHGDVIPYTRDHGCNGEIIIDVANSSDKPIKIKQGDNVAGFEVLKMVRLPVGPINVENLDHPKASPAAAAMPADKNGSESEEPEVIRMPLRTMKFQHRPGQKTPFIYSACVAKPITRKEWKLIPKAMEAMDKEWDKLRALRCWEEDKVMEFTELRKKEWGKTIHVARIFDICVIKNSELPEGHPLRKYKGRVVFEGCNVKDEKNNWAIFSEIASCPATMEAGKACDAIGLIDGNTVECADGESAYTQAELKGAPTWIRIADRDRWPKSWFNPDGSCKYVDPVCPLRLALYGHPDAGGFWEEHCEERLTRPEIGFVPIKNWRSCFWHPRLKLYLVVYVDDFKMAGPKDKMKEGWDLISSVIKMEEPGPVDRYLGCHHRMQEHDVKTDFQPRFDPRLDLRAAEDAEKALKGRICKQGKKQRYKLELAKRQAKEEAEKRDTGLSGESTDTGGSSAEESDGTPRKAKKDKSHPDIGGVIGPLLNGPPGKSYQTIKAMKYDMKEFLEQCVDRYTKLAEGKMTRKLKHAETPFLDESKPEFDENPPAPGQDVKISDIKAGVLGDIASAVLMKILYAARMGRFDLIRPVQGLASKITKWTALCDRQLHRLVEYIQSTLDDYMWMWVGDRPEHWELVLYCDADLAGDRTDAKSTSGIFMCIIGPRTFVPLTAISKKQSCVSKSTAEAEIVAIDQGLAKEALPALDLWEVLLGRTPVIRVMEDNQAASRILITGRNPSMRHMSRTQRIDISWLNDLYRKGLYSFVDCPTVFQAADIMTKANVDKIVWDRNLKLIGIFAEKDLGFEYKVPKQDSDPPVAVNHHRRALAGGASPLFDSVPNHNIKDSVPLVVFNNHRDLYPDKGVESTVIETYLFKHYVSYRGAASSGCRMLRTSPCANMSASNWPGPDHDVDILARTASIGPVTNVAVAPSLNAERYFDQGGQRNGWRSLRTRMIHTKAMLRQFIALCKAFNSDEDVIVLIIPAGTLYWKRSDIHRFASVYSLSKIPLRPCKHNLGPLIHHTPCTNEPWHVFTNDSRLVSVIKDKMCLDHTRCDDSCVGGLDIIAAVQYTRS